MSAAAKGSSISVDDLVLPVSESYDPSIFDLGAYEDFVDGVVGSREYSRQALRRALIFLCSTRFGSTRDLAEKAFAGDPRLAGAYGTVEALVARLPFPDKLACSIDLATGTGKSYVMFALARVMLNEGLVSRVLVLCPSLTIEAGLIEKFEGLLGDPDLTSLLPEREGVRLPDLVNASETVKEGQICIENIHAAYGATGSSIRDSFAGQGAKTLVLSDEAHHLHSPSDEKLKKWREFVADDAYGFRYHVGLSGTCYTGNEYFADVVHRYSIREAIDDRWVKDVYYVEKDDSKTDDERFQKLLAQHEKNRRTYKQVKPITIAVTKTIKAAKALREDLVGFLATHVPGGREEAEEKVLVVTSAGEHEKNLAALATVDEASSPVEWIVSVSMLTEGWDVKNVFQIYPHEKRAFNSRLLIAQVLGRGLRRPPGLDQEPRVYVFSHTRWGPEIDSLVADVIDRDTTIAQRPVESRGSHFEIHRLVFKQMPTKLKAAKPEKAKKMTKPPSLSPQMDAPDRTDFVAAGNRGARETLVTRIAQTYYSVDEVVAEVRRRMADHDQRTGGTLTKEYPKASVEKLIRAGLAGVKETKARVSQENRQQILSAFGSLQQKRTRPGAVWASKPDGLATVSTAAMPPVSARIAALTADVALFYDEETEKLVEGDDAAALEKAKELDAKTPTRLERIANSYVFKSPVTLVLASHTPEREFAKRLFEEQNAKAISSWVKSPDVGFFDVEYGYSRNGRRKNARFNPDFFLHLDGTNEVAVVETKADGDVTAVNRGKARAATSYFEIVNGMLEGEGDARRYRFHFLSPGDYEMFFAALREGNLAGFRSTLHADLLA